MAMVASLLGSGWCAEIASRLTGHCNRTAEPVQDAPAGAALRRVAVAGWGVEG